MKNKKAAMEMSVGTIVTIVLLMTALILGLVLVRTIFRGATENIEGVNDAVRAEVEKLFSEDTRKRVVIIPSTREVVLNKGDSTRGFGLSIRNLGDKGKFSYSIDAQEIACNKRLADADNLVSLNKQRNDIIIEGGSKMEDPIFVKFNIPETFPPCEIVYSINIEKDRETYGSSLDVYLMVKPE